MGVEAFSLGLLTDDEAVVFDDTVRELDQAARLSDEEANALARIDLAASSGQIDAAPAPAYVDGSIVNTPDFRHASFGGYFAALSGINTRLEDACGDSDRADLLSDLADLRAANPGFHKQEFDRYI